MGYTAAMDQLRAHMSRVRIPEPSNRIYKQECCVSFATPLSEGGLFVDMNTFLAFGREHVLWNFQKTGNPVYLNIKERPKPVSEDRPYKKPTLLAIGVQGGFDNKEPETEVSYTVVVLPEFLSLPFPNVELPEKVRLAVDAVVAAVGAERKEQVAAWTASEKRVSSYAAGLVQLDNGVKVQPSGWKCSQCDKTENLWLNLTDGMIFCGRRNWDGSGGNNHAIQHYEETKYPLAVKLGTITADLDGADVYSYPEDDTVEDSLLAEHLEHFGIDFSALKKTEMTTAERELDQNVNFDWNRLQEKGKELKPLFGPGYTGLVNLGNSCYLASVMQAVFSTTSFQNIYYDNLKLDDAFQRAPADPTLDLNTQLSKLAHGLLSGRYSCPPEQQMAEKEVLDDADGEVEQRGIPPRMFKHLIGAGHSEFGSSRQQDALEFLQHFLEQVERTYVSKPFEDPSRCFRFSVEERILCSQSNKVRYNRKTDNVLSLGIPLQAAVNSAEYLAFQKKAEKEVSGQKMDDADIVRPRVPLSACLERFFAPEEVQGFYSTATKSKTTAIKTTRLASFPDYLVLHMRKFVLDEGWVPKKLDVFVDVPDELDISSMLAKGLQPGEALLPEEDEAEEAGPSADAGIVAQLTDMGFPQVRCEKAARFTSNSGVEEAMNWLLMHMDDPDIDYPESTGREKAPAFNETHVETLSSLGFSPDVARKALKLTGGDVERAVEWICSHPDEVNSMDVKAAPPPELDFPVGTGRYRLMAFISHMGTSTQSGHYVVHVRKEGRWVIFNDSKVAMSGDPPKDMGYLYFFQQVAS